MENRNKNLVEPMEDKEKVCREIFISRRQFLKKTAYITPSIIVLGNLPIPVIAGASTIDTTNTNFGGFGGGNSGGFGSGFGG